METAIDTQRRRGRKPLGERAMTPAEAKRRSREKMRAAGARDFLMTVGPRHLVWIKRLAEKREISEAAALHEVLDNALDYFASVMICYETMLLKGASQEDGMAFLLKHWPLPPPPMPEILAGSE